MRLPGLSDVVVITRITDWYFLKGVNPIYIYSIYILT